MEIYKGWKNFATQISFAVDEGSRIRFSHDIYCGDLGLNKVFPALYRVVIDRDASVSDLQILSHGSYQWDVCFTRSVHDWEIE